MLIWQVVSIGALALALGTSPARARGNIIANGDFSKGMARWELSSPGAVVSAPGEKANKVLKVDKIEEIFGLSQKTNVPSGKRTLSIRFRAMATRATEENPVQLRFRLYDAKGNSGFAAWSLKASGLWKPCAFTFEDVLAPVVSVLLENNRGEGSVYLDDFVLE